jgi:membrane-associated PAP2 superfamily phosphatase
MSRDFFDRLDAELAELTRHGAHLTVGDRVYRRAGRLLRRGVVFALVAVALAAALVSEFPASASGHAQMALALTARQL